MGNFLKMGFMSGTTGHDLLEKYDVELHVLYKNFVVGAMTRD